jgi:hypothetical protein
MKWTVAIVAVAVGATGLCRADDARHDFAIQRKAVLYEEDQATTGFQFVGSAVWRTEREFPGQGALRAAIEIPEQKIEVRLSLRAPTAAPRGPSGCQLRARRADRPGREPRRGIDSGASC